MRKRALFLALVAALIGLSVFALMSNLTPVNSADDSSAPALLFVTESARALQGWTLDSAGYWRADDLHGVYYTNADGHRATTGEGHGAALYVLGNSTVYGYGLSDADTVPSVLQSLLPDRRVINLGAIPSTAIQQLVQLQRLPLRVGDTVIVLGGVSEAAAVYNTPPNGRTLSQIEAILFPRYEQAIVRASAYAHSKGVRYVYLLQPVAFSMQMTAQEQALAAKTALQNAAMAQMWPDLQAMVTRLETQGIDARDWTHVLDDYRRAGKLAYIDYCHFTPDAARVVAGMMVVLGRNP